MKINLKFVTVFLLAISIYVAIADTNGPQLLKFVFPNQIENASAHTLPLFIAVPDSLCSLSVKNFIVATEEQLTNMATKETNTCLEQSRGTAEFLLTIRAMMQNQVQDAVQGFIRLRKRKLPTDIAYCSKVNEAVLKYLLGGPEEAEETLKLLLIKYEWKEASWKNLFSLYFGRGWYAKADSLVEEILASSPKTIWAQKYKINLIHMLGTRLDLQQYLKAKSSWKDSMFLIQIAYGKLLKENGQKESAISYYNRGLEGSPQYGEGWLELAELYYDQSNLDLTNKCLMLAIKAGINNPLYFKLLALLFQERIFFTFVKLRLYERDKSECLFSIKPGSCRAYFDKVINTEVYDSFRNIKDILEDAFLQGIYVREVSRMLYYSYGALGLKLHAQNLKNQLWFHFESPYPVHLNFGEPYFPKKRLLLLKTEFTPVTFPLYLNFLRKDFLTFVQ
ncbi:MAG: hypothetical protein HQK83_15660 [Fibrobacteria bacterium]|nr:hypothetical protein [Fibrobacteria bacterium]